MLENFSSSAIAAKARAMYGQRLTASDYNEMMKRATVPEVAVYLRDNTHYGSAMAEMGGENTHRGQIEDRLRQFRYDQYARLINYSFSKDAKFWNYLFLWDEVEQVINIMRYFGSGSEGDYLPSYSRHLMEHCSYDLKALLQCRSYRDMMEVMAGTDYQKILERYPPRGDGDKNQIDMVMCERDLEVYYYDKVFAMIDKEFSGNDAKELREIFMGRIDAQKLTSAYRLRRFFKSTPEYISEALLPYKTSSQKLIQRIMHCDDNAELLEIMSSSRLNKNEALDEDYIESMTNRERERVSRKMLRYSRCPACTLVSYMTQTEIELENIINIVEGIRYGMVPEDIKKLLIIPAKA